MQLNHVESENQPKRKLHFLCVAYCIFKRTNWRPSFLRAASIAAIHGVIFMQNVKDTIYQSTTTTVFSARGVIKSL